MADDADLLAEMKDILGDASALTKMRNAFVFKESAVEGDAPAGEEKKKKKRKRARGDQETSVKAENDGGERTVTSGDVGDHARKTAGKKDPPAQEAVRKRDVGEEEGPLKKKRKKGKTLVETAVLDAVLPVTEKRTSAQKEHAVVPKSSVEEQESVAPAQQTQGKKPKLKKKKASLQKSSVEQRAPAPPVLQPTTRPAPVVSAKPTGFGGLLANLRANATGAAAAAPTTSSSAPGVSSAGAAIDPSSSTMGLASTSAKLAGSRFRELNEELYTIEGKNAFKWFKSQPHLFEVYHAGFAAQASQWPEKPVDKLIGFLKARCKISDERGTVEPVKDSSVVGEKSTEDASAGDVSASSSEDERPENPVKDSDKKKPSSSTSAGTTNAETRTTKHTKNPLDDTVLQIADLGCGEAQIARDLDGLLTTNRKKSTRVLSYDMVGKTTDFGKKIQSSNINAHVPCVSHSCDAVVLCLALMGTDCGGALKESFRILKQDGILVISEVTSRFESLAAFVKQIEVFGFRKLMPSLDGGGRGSAAAVGGGGGGKGKGKGGKKGGKGRGKKGAAGGEQGNHGVGQEDDPIAELEVENTHFFCCAFAKKGGVRKPPDSAKLIAKACIYKRR